jgi:hypothetical protein
MFKFEKQPLHDAIESDFTYKLNNLPEKVKLFHKMFLSKQPKHIKIKKTIEVPVLQKVKSKV